MMQCLGDRLLSTSLSVSVNFFLQKKTICNIECVSELLSTEMGVRGELLSAQYNECVDELLSTARSVSLNCFQLQ